jgi:hypothetical protein
MGKMTLEILSRQIEQRFKSVDARFDKLDTKLSEHVDLLHLIADTVSRHDDDLTYLKRTLRHQRV